MLKSALRAVMAFAVIIPFCGSAVQADQGLTFLHSKVRVGNRICFSGHDHGGGASGPTQKAALRNAIARWSSFTAWEYGKAWGKYSIATRKTKNCYADGRHGWYCNIRAIPCSYAGSGKSHHQASSKHSRRHH